jgi:hypothetical protein
MRIDPACEMFKVFHSTDKRAQNLPLRVTSRAAPAKALRCDADQPTRRAHQTSQRTRQFDNRSSARSDLWLTFRTRQQ